MLAANLRKTSAVYSWSISIIILAGSFVALPGADNVCEYRSSSISTPKALSCARKAQSTWRNFLWPMASSSSEPSLSAAQTTGIMIVPTFLSPDLRMALPTAWTISISDWRGSTKITPSRAGTSIPSLKHRALASKLCELEPFFSIASLSWRTLEDIVPSTWSAWISAGMPSMFLPARVCNMWIKLLERRIVEWNDMALDILYCFKALAEAIVAAKSWVVVLLPSTST